MAVEESIRDLCLAQSDVFYRPKDESIENAIEALKHQKTGHFVYWEELVERFDFTMGSWTETVARCECSECGQEHYPEEINHIHYCRMCGAKLEGVIEKEE